MGALSFCSVVGLTSPRCCNHVTVNFITYGFAVAVGQSPLQHVTQWHSPIYLTSLTLLPYHVTRHSHLGLWKQININITHHHGDHHPTSPPKLPHPGLSLQKRPQRRLPPPTTTRRQYRLRIRIPRCFRPHLKKSRPSCLLQSNLRLAQCPSEEPQCALGNCLFSVSQQQCKPSSIYFNTIYL